MTFDHTPYPELPQQDVTEDADPKLVERVTEALRQEPQRSPVFNAFLKKQAENAERLNRESSVVRVQGFPPMGYDYPQLYGMHFSTVGLIRDASGEIRECASHTIAVHFNDDYLRRINPFEIVRWREPEEIWAPNIDGRGVICLGHIPPGMSLIELARQIHEIIAYQRFATHDALNLDAANWARDRLDRFPTDSRGLFGSTFEFDVEGESE